MLNERQLKKGERIAFAGKRWRVVSVSECAATVVPLTKETVEIQGRTFKAAGEPLRISPYSEVERI
jgi:hypothetical protein